jgi:hypothetical protein
VNDFSRLFLAGCGYLVASLSLCTASIAQQAPPPLPTRLYMIASVDSGLCWDVPGGRLVSGARIQQFRCHGGGSQLWRMFSASSGQLSGALIQLELGSNSGNGWCATKGSNSTLTLTACTTRSPSTSQLWRFTQPLTNVGIPHFMDSIETVTRGECVDLPSGLDNPQINLAVVPCNNNSSTVTGPNQKWLLLQGS